MFRLAGVSLCCVCRRCVSHRCVLLVLALWFGAVLLIDVIIAFIWFSCFGCS